MHKYNINKKIVGQKSVIENTHTSSTECPVISDGSFGTDAAAAVGVEVVLKHKWSITLVWILQYA